MSIHLLRDLDRLKRDILFIGRTVEEAIGKAVRSLEDRRVELAEEVIAGDEGVDRLEVSVEEDCLKILALHQPVAADLRFIITVLKVNNDLERMGDHAKNIAERSISLAKGPYVPEIADLGLMVETVRQMVRESLDSLVGLDEELADKVHADDEIVDNAHREMFSLLEAHMRKSPDDIGRCVEVLSVSRHLERIADLATNIAEDVIFMVRGEIVRHRSSVLPR